MTVDGYDSAANLRAMEITYRKPGPHEAEAFAALHVQCWRECYPGILRNHHHPHPAALLNLGKARHVPRNFC